jgi:hypothetical protein
MQTTSAPQSRFVPEEKAGVHAWEIDGDLAGIPPELAHPVPGTKRRLLSEGAKEKLRSARSVPGATRRLLDRATRVTLDDARWANARERLVLGVSASLIDSLPEGVAHEAVLRLYADPDLRLEFVGRGHVMRKLTSHETKNVLTLEDPRFSRRRYFFRRIAADEDEPGATPEFRKLYAKVASWVSDPDARLVLSIGGGGYRAFACTPVLKMLERMLVDRRKVAEVWGCSGGVLAAHVLAEGFDIGVLDEFAYRLYHRSESGVRDWTIPSVAQLHLRRLLGSKENVQHTIQGTWMELFERLQPKHKRDKANVPFFAVASNRTDGRCYGLTDAPNVSASCTDFLVATDRQQALAASCAVPLIFPTERGILGEKDEWVDGGVLEENPLALPFIKWSRERREDPAKVPSKLKIFLFDLNMRTTESAMLSALSRLPLGPLGGITGTVDMLLDSRSRLSLAMLAEVPNVEVMIAKLSIGAFAVRDRPSILTAVQRGRSLNAWSFSVVGGGRGSGAQVAP